MPDINAQTLNAEPAPAGASDPSPDVTMLSSPDSLLPGAVSSASSEETPNTEAKDAGSQGVDTAGGSTDGEDAPWHKDPRFKQFLDDSKALKSKLAEIDEIKASLTSKKEEAPVQEFKDILGLDDDEIRTWMEEDPKGFAANIHAQVKAEVKNDLKAEDAQLTQQQRIIKTFDDYKAKNSDFQGMWEDGTIPNFMKENPGHNAISAHMAITEQKRIEAAVKDAESKMRANILAKKESRVLGGGPAHAGPTVDQALNNTREHGGRLSVMANRLAQLRRGKAA